MTLLLCAFALWPLLYRPGLPNGTDVLYHVYRAAEMDRSWSHGVLFPRWAESFYTGYGAPVFHYYASLSYYLTTIFTRLFGLDAVNSLRLLIAVSMLGGGAAMYGFMRPRAGIIGGVIAALCYIYSPYILFTEPYARGAYPEMAALALLPLIFWRYDRVLRGGGAFALVTAALSSGALIITHNLMALVLTGLLFGWLLWRLLGHFLTARFHGARPYFLALLAAAFGIGLTAYFWLPGGILEGGAVRLGNLTAVAQLDYRNFFVPLSKLLAFSPRPDGGAVNGLFHQLNLGMAQWVLALLSLVVLLVGIVRRFPSAVSRGSDFIFFALAGIVCVLLMIPAAASVWEPIAPLAFLQFPWRFLGPAAFCLAILAGMNGLWIERLSTPVGGAIAAVIIVIIIGLALPTLYAPEWIHPTVDSSVAAYQAAEVKGLQRATTFSNEYLPKDVQTEPGATPRLLADYADGYPVNKVHLETLPKGVTVTVLDHGPEHDVWQVNTPSDFTLEVLTFNFLGWQAAVDGQPVPITPSVPHGLITLPVPSGNHMVRVFLGSTPARNLGSTVSIASVLMLVGSILIVRQSHKPASSLPEITLTAGLRAGLAVGAVLTMGLMVLVMRPNVAWLESPPGEALPAQNKVVYALGQQIEMLGYDLNGRAFKPGDRVELSVYWYARAPIPYGYASFVHIATGGPPLAQADKQNPAGRPTKEWTSAGYIRDDYAIDLPPSMPPGEYQLLVGLYTCDTLPVGNCGNGDRLKVTDANGSAVGESVPMGKITVQ